MGIITLLQRQTDSSFTVWTLGNTVGNYLRDLSCFAVYCTPVQVEKRGLGKGFALDLLYLRSFRKYTLKSKQTKSQLQLPARGRFPTDRYKTEDVKVDCLYLPLRDNSPPCNRS